MTTDDAPRWLTAGQMRAWLRLQAVVELLPGALDSQLRRDSGLTHFEYLVLAMLSQSDGHALRMSRLAQVTNATLPRLSHVVRRLEGRGLVTRAPDPDDGRATIATLTPAGWDVVAEAAPGHARTVLETVFDRLDPDTLAGFDRALGTVLDQLDPDGTHGPLP